VGRIASDSDTYFGYRLKSLTYCPVFLFAYTGASLSCLPGGLHSSKAEWSIDELAQQAQNCQQGEERKLVAAQLVRIVGLNARKGWKDNNLVPEIFESFSAVMPQKDNLRMMWTGLLK
jgi:hypothetical protein